MFLAHIVPLGRSGPEISCIIEFLSKRDGVKCMIINNTSHDVIFAIRRDYAHAVGRSGGKLRSLTFDGAQADMAPLGVRGIVSLRAQASYATIYHFDSLPRRGDEVYFTLKPIERAFFERTGAEKDMSFGLKQKVNSNTLRY